MRPRSRAIRARSIVSVVERVRLAEVLAARGAVHEALGEPERGRADRPARRPRVALRRAPEIGGSGVGVAFGQRAVRGLAQSRHPELDRPRPREQQVRGDLLGRRVGLGEELLRPLRACARARRRSGLGVDRGADDRMDEGEASLDAQQPVPRERRRGVRSQLGVDPGQRRRVGAAARRPRARRPPARATSPRSAAAQAEGCTERETASGPSS